VLQDRNDLGFGETRLLHQNLLAVRCQKALLSSCRRGGEAYGTTRTMTRVTPEKAKTELKVGDQVRIETASGLTAELKLTAIDQERLWGTSPRGERLSFAFEELRSVESTRFSAAKTAGAISGTVVLLYILGILAFAIGISSGG
ncbi:hypothetical protein, partial [Sinimarinibacterium thermocellulolyticum]